MALRGVLLLGEVALRVLDLGAAVRHYRDVIGLVEVMRDPSGRVYFKAWDEHDHHSLVVHEAGAAGMDYFAFKVRDEADLDVIAERIAARGMPFEWIPAGRYPKSGRRLAFLLPSGHRMHLYAEKEKIGNGIETLNPEVIPDPAMLKGMAPSRLDHCLFYGTGVNVTRDFFIEVLDFEVTEQIVKEATGETLGVFLSCSNKGHDVAFISYPEPGRFHHISFYLESVQDLYRAGDLMGRYRVSVDVGPTRHGITRGATIYFFDPSGNRNEVFSGSYIRYPDMPVLTWHDTHLGYGACYPDGRLVESFLTVVT